MMNETLKNPKISVIIPTWNRALSLKRAISSALRQTYPPHEILVCDDGSTDNSEEVVRAMGDSRIRWIAGPHAGCPAVPRNRGIATSEGDWIAFLDSDDAWLPEKLEAQIAVVRKTGARAVCTNAYRDLGAPTTETLISWDHKQLRFTDLLQDNKVVCSSVLVNRVLLEATGGFPEDLTLRVGEDYLLWLKVSRLTPIAYIDDPLILYKDEPATSVRAQGPSIATQRRRVFADYLAWRAGKLPPAAVVDGCAIGAMIALEHLKKRYYNGRTWLGTLRRKFSVRPSGTATHPVPSWSVASSDAPTVSVLLPVHNAAVYVRRAIDSILRQTYSDFELIVINDASTDGSAIVLDDINDPRIVRLTFEKNQGIVNSLNAGLAKARGRYIARMDADDIATPDRFTCQVAYLDQNRNVCVVGSWIRGFGDVRHPYIHRYPISHAEIQANLLFESPLAHPSVMIRRDMLDRLEHLYSENFPYVEDWELWSRLVHAGKAANIPLPLLNYRIHVKSLSQRFTVLQNDSKLRLLKRNYAEASLPFRPEFVLGAPESNRKWLAACYAYFKELACIAHQQGSLEHVTFYRILQDQLLERVRQMKWLGIYPAWFVFRHCLIPSGIVERLVPALRILLITNARALRHLTK